MTTPVWPRLMKNMYVEAFLHSFQSRMWDIPTLHSITAINSFHCPMLGKKKQNGNTTVNFAGQERRKFCI